MSRRSGSVVFLSIAGLLLSVSALGCGGGSDGNPPPGMCGDLTNYTPTATGTVSFATDVLPILQDQGTSQGASCATASICHGSTPAGLDPFGTKTLTFVGDAATVKAALMASSVNAPTMKRVVASKVSDSFMAYKISGTSSLNCIKTMCMSGNTTGTATACGDAMPTLGTLSMAQRTTILDWIAKGAAD